MNEATTESSCQCCVHAILVIASSLSDYLKLSVIFLSHENSVSLLFKRGAAKILFKSLTFLPNQIILASLRFLSYIMPSTRAGILRHTDVFDRPKVHFIGERANLYNGYRGSPPSTTTRLKSAASPHSTASSYQPSHISPRSRNSTNNSNLSSPPSRKHISRDFDDENWNSSPSSRYHQHYHSKQLARSTLPASQYKRYHSREGGINSAADKQKGTIPSRPHHHRENFRRSLPYLTFPFHPISLQRQVYNELVPLNATSWRRLVVKERIESTHHGGFIVRQSLLSGRSYTVRRDWLRGSRRRTLHDACGRPLYRLHLGAFSLHGSMRLKDVRKGVTIATVKRHNLLPPLMLGAAHLRVWEGASESGRHMMEIQGLQDGHHFPVRCAKTGHLIAMIKRARFSVPASVIGRQTYIIQIPPGTDAGIIIMLAVAIHQTFIVWSTVFLAVCFAAIVLFNVSSVPFWALNPFASTTNITITRPRMSYPCTTSDSYNYTLNNALVAEWRK